MLWSDVEGVYAAILAHPFVTGLTDGTLPRESFRHYIAQDAHYLRGYARALAICAARAPTSRTPCCSPGTPPARSPRSRTCTPRSRRAGRAGSGDAFGEPVGPTTRAYVSYLLATCYGGSFAEGLGAVLPCYWIYAKVGAELLTRGSPDPLYARWIAMYGGDEFQAIVDSVLALTDRIGPGLGEAERALMREHFTTTARYEWMFWDAGYRRETWPV